MAIVSRIEFELARGRAELLAALGRDVDRPGVADALGIDVLDGAGGAAEQLLQHRSCDMRKTGSSQPDPRRQRLRQRRVGARFAEWRHGAWPYCM